MVVFGAVEGKTVGIDQRYKPVELLLRRAVEIPWGKGKFRCIPEHAPGEQAVGVDEMAFQIEGVGNRGEIVAWRMKLAQAIEGPALQQLGQGSFDGRFEPAVGPERRIGAAASGIGEQGADYRKPAAKRCVFHPHDKTALGQFVDNPAEPGVLPKNRLRDIRQAYPLGDNDIFHMPFENLGQCLGAAFRP
ncbi:MAG: hypothetical protein ACD_75C00414G0004 [uncultured bacterium]|nr:MAG: hypothetical protein ACD_75C00414G0004 [uncultured bacterium]